MKKSVKIAFFVALGLLVLLFIIYYVYFRSDLRMFKKISGNYQMIAKNGDSDKKWHLYIGEHQGEERYFTIYDNGGVIRGDEHPWIIGIVEKVEKDKITVRLDEIQFNSITSEWKVENGKLILDFEKNEKILVLTNGNYSITFEIQKYETN